ncbi:transglutaminase domain-containing protein [Flavobacterium cyanobacteriorum]|uniref:transglutaminase domain-containing protein n=1 Tax=Flavobacterium cyanobacteriorum TaxID=2022802 RepID=UPI0021CFD128|nr:transglutaminase domain-containing protein [Flavobacterium cyanobacteriorum]
MADKINTDFTRDDEKARAIFTWIATNVKYDLAAYTIAERPVAYSFRTQEEKMAKERKFKDDLAIKTLKTRKGVCQGYATLFESLAQSVGLEAVIIPGTSKSHPTHIGKAPGASDHAWNAVKINGQWKLLDVTWGAGTVTGEPLKFDFRFNDGYFFTSPDDFVLNHYPDNEKWLLTNADKDDFASFPLYYGSYLMEGFRFMAPGRGLVAYTVAGTVPFKIKNLKPGDRIAYRFTKDPAFKEVQPKQDGDVAEFEIPLGSNTGGYLTVYINQRSVASYRIVKS